jgi:hypothetical protein
MRLRSICFAVTLMAAAVTSLGSAQAAGILVTTDSGNIGGFTATNEGVVGNTATILFAVPNETSQMNTVNGLFITPEPTAVIGPLTLTVMVTAAGSENYNLALVPPTAVQTVGGTLGSQAIMDFNLQHGVAPSVLPNFFNMSGLITSLVANLNPNLDFSNFAHGGDQNITLTATSFTGATSFATFFQNVGATAVGNGSFSQVAVPEPTSVGMLGVGMCGLFAFRRYFRKARA